MTTAIVMARRAIRVAVASVLRELTGVNVESPGNLETPPTKLPMIFVRAPGENKASTNKTLPEFTTTVDIEIVARVSAPTESEAQDVLELLGQQIETAVFCAPSVIAYLQQIAYVRTTVDVTNDGNLPLAEMRMVVGCETFEVFDPTVLAPEVLASLREMVIHLDLLRPFDPGAAGTGGLVSGVPEATTGTEYPPHPFPVGVNRAPRVSGRDGRDEAVLHIPLGGP